jgi:hypothetical protein
MQRAYPQFACRGTRGRYTFRGDLQPNAEGETYAVEVTCRPGAIPRVRVLSPVLDDDAPHRFKDGSLCLFHPRIFEWHGGRLVSDYIVPWTAAWLFFYEHWLDLGVWLGPEAPHRLDDACR